MYNLTAKNETIEQVFQREYLIPDYQRRYTWDKAQCQQLMEDLLSVHYGLSEQHFLGCLVIARQSGDIPRWEVIDGQQRLTTLSLVIKALFQRSGENQILEGMLKKRNRQTGKFKDGEFRLESEVWAGDKEQFNSVLRCTGEPDTDNKFGENFACIKKALSAVADGSELGRFIERLQTRMFLMPIECESPDSALTIFQTLNDRGMPLNDSDIFKAGMYKHTDANLRKQFVADWNELLECEKSIKNFVERLFRIRMHILRAKKGETGKEGELRKFFGESGELKTPNKLARNLKKYRAIFFDDWGAVAPDIDIWWHILDTMPNLYWQYPLFVFLDKHTPEYDASKGESFSLPEEKTQEFITLMKDTARYLFINGVATKSVNTIKDTVFGVCSAIAHGKDYAHLYNEDAKANLVIFQQKLEGGDYGRYQKGLVLANSALLCDSPKWVKGYSELLWGKYDIEHILPREWCNYDGWNKETHAEWINKLGNLIPFERRLNIHASNAFFARKQEKYACSKSVEVQELGQRKNAKWTPEELKSRHDEVIARLKEFFRY